jgi:hypothetical protein
MVLGDEKFLLSVLPFFLYFFIKNLLIIGVELPCSTKNSILCVTLVLADSAFPDANHGDILILFCWLG